MEILRTVINILFILDCIALTVIVLMKESPQGWELLQVQQILTGERTKAVLWKEHL